MHRPHPIRRSRAFLKPVRDISRFLIVRDPNKLAKEQKERALEGLESLIDWLSAVKGRLTIGALGALHVVLLYDQPSRAVIFVVLSGGVLIGIAVGGLMMFNHMQGAALDAELKRISVTNDGIHDFVISGETPAVVLTQESFMRRILEHLGAR